MTLLRVIPFLGMKRFITTFWDDPSQNFEQYIRSYFDQCFEKNSHIKFDRQLPHQDALSFFLHWICKYWSCENYENFFKYPKSDFDRMIVKFIPLLSTFSTQNIQFGTLEERRNARSNINILFPSELENTTLILDATPLPIERRRDEPLNGDEGVWDEAHKMFAYKVIALMDLNYIFRFVSEAKPGAHHDIYRQRGKSWNMVH